MSLSLRCPCQCGVRMHPLATDLFVGQNYRRLMARHRCWYYLP